MSKNNITFAIKTVSFVADSSDTDTLAFPFKDDSNNPFSKENEGLNLGNPSNIKTEVEYNPETGGYEIKQKLGDSLDYRPSMNMGLDEYLDYNMENSKKDYWREKSQEQSHSTKKGFKPTLDVENKTLDKIFGGSVVDIKPSGSAELKFGVKSSKVENPTLSKRNQRTTLFDFDMKIQLNVVGTIGDKLKLSTNYNTESTFEFENQMKLAYTGQEDEIIKSIEAGNVSLPLTGTLITGSQTLFGIKTQLQFGKLMVTSVLSQEKGKKSELEIKGGAQIQKFEVRADDYEQNKHFLLAHYFKDNYEGALSSPPIINSLINITRVEVWVTNTNNATVNTRNVIAFQDLGESRVENMYNPKFGRLSSDLPQNNDSLYRDGLYRNLVDASVRNFSRATSVLSAEPFNFQSKRDYQKVELARKLKPNEFYLQPQLGYISLRQQLNNNQMLAIAFQYTHNGKVYQVGEFSDDIQGQEALLLKMLKSTERNTRIPMWDLMMKNVYAIGAYNVQKQGFKMDIWYMNANTGVENNFLPEGKPKNQQLLGILGLDRLTVNGLRGIDGVFDYIATPRITINPQNGRIYFPSLKPFGEYLGNKYDNPEIAAKYTFDSLYTNTQAIAKVKFPDKNRFVIRGETKSSSGSEISLGAINIPEGSVVVRSGGVPLVENSDYLVDYNLGRVTIINQSVLESGTPIKISLESQELFAIQQKTLLASRFDYTLSDDIVLGGTIMNLSERPITPKVNYGNEPMSNTIIGVDGTFKKEVPLITTLIDKLPLIETKAPSNVNISGEVAKIFPGHSRGIGKEGTSYVDDFEGTQTSINIMSGSISSWVLASTPQGQNDLFPEGSLIDKRPYGFNRAKLAWYVIDPLFFPSRKDKNIPQNVKDDVDMTSNHYMREIPQSEVFPQKDFQAGTFNNLATFDLAYYPEEKGPYNYDTKSTQYSAGVDDNGNLKNPDSRWGGIMRRIETNDFEAANVQFIQFWVMDPFAESGADGFPDGSTNGKLYFNIGQISEDILRDGQKTFEQGMPTDETGAIDLTDSSQFSNWGRIPPPGTQTIVQAFENDPTTRPFQDVGLDGLRNQEENIFFRDYIDELPPGSVALQKALADPSSDDYNFYRDDAYDNANLNILERYKYYNGLEGNSATSEQYKTQNAAGYPTTSSQKPSVEDINNDNTLDDVESYFQYSIDISPSAISPSSVGTNYITNVLQTKTQATSNGDVRNINWYQFKIPIEEFEKAVGGIADFRSIRFFRMFVKGFDKPIFLRFAKLELVRGEWRKYTETINSGGEILNEEETQDFDISALNIEENSERTPVNYVLPPGIQRELNASSQNLQRLNEQSMALQMCNLPDGAAYAAYKTVDFDMRRYKRLKMYTHLEERIEQPLQDDDLNVFVRLGTDFADNYYEYEIPLKVTAPGRYSTASDQSDKTKKDQLAVWPEANNIDILLEDLYKLKMIRNRRILEKGSEFSIKQVYDTLIGKATIRVIGNPNIATVRTIMIGVRNPRDDGETKCGIIWVNELRLTEFDERGGWAAVGRISANLADFGNVAISGAYSTPGFGSIEQKVNQRQKEKRQSIDASATFQLGKLFPEDFGLRLPMYVGYSRSDIIPEFSPLASDIPTKVFENEFLGSTNIQQRDSIRRIVRDITTRKSINFTNIKKEKSKKPADKKSKKKSKNHFYDISNVTGSYAYTEENHTNFEVQKDLIKNYKGGLSYNFNATPKNIKPFGKVKAFRKSKYLRIIKDFNFYPGPKQIGFRTDMNRMYGEKEIRNVNPNTTASIPALFNKKFIWNRQYNLKYDLSKALKVSFDATNLALIEEGDSILNQIDRKSAVDSFKIFKQTVRNSIQNGGTNLDYRHNINVNYKLPLNKFPLTNWINSNAKYTSSYNWQRASFAKPSFGNTIQNSQKFSINGSFNFITLYNKVPYMKKVNQKFRKAGRRKPPPKKKKEEKKNPKDEKEEDKDKKKKKEKDKGAITILDRGTKLLMSVRNLNSTYSQTRGILMPGYAPGTQIMGMDNQFSAPGTGFILGQQKGFDQENESFNTFASSRGWLMKNDSINQKYTETYVENLNLRSSIQPVRDFKIDLTSTMTNTTNLSEQYRWQNDPNDPELWLHESQVFTGNYSSTIQSFSTAFIKDGDKDVSPVFQQFLENRGVISSRLGDNNEASTGNYQYITPNDTIDNTTYRKGYGPTSTGVLAPAFLAAYTGQNAKDVGLDPLNVGYNGVKYLPLPNWRVRYTGLSKINALKKYLKTVTLNHSYKSTYNVSGYSTNLNYDKDLAEQAIDLSGNYETEFVINTITISEQFGPLIGIDMTWKNSLQTRFEYKKDRSLSMSMTNAQLTEINGKEYVIGLGYTIQQVKLPFELRKGTPVQSDLKLRADFSIRDNKTTIRKVVEKTNQPTAGQVSYSLKVTADYQLSKALRLRGYYDWTKNNPYLSRSFDTSNTNAGVSILFTLGA